MTIQNNLMFNSRYDAIYLSEGGTVNILSNTIDKNLAMPAISAYKTKPITIKNNLITTNNGGIYFWSIGNGYVIDYNDLWNNGTKGKLNYLGCKPTGTHELYRNPQYVGTGNNEMEKHELEASSPVLKAGEGGTRMGWTRPADATVTTTPIVMVNGVFFTHSDHLGSSSVVTDRAGAVKQLVDYFPYGSVHFEELGSNYDNDYLYTGKELDEEMGLYYYGARYYNAVIGRFVSVDPLVLSLGTSMVEYLTGNKTFYFIANPQQLNLYAYGLDNPIRYNDPAGYQAAQATPQYAQAGVSAGAACLAVIQACGPVVLAGAAILGTAAAGLYIGTKIGEWIFGSPTEEASQPDTTAPAENTAQPQTEAGPQAATAGSPTPKNDDGDEDNYDDWKDLDIEWGLSKPNVTDLKLQNLVKDLYKGLNSETVIGRGSAADAVRYTKATGKLVHGSDHIQKAQEYIKALQNWLNKYPNTASIDRQAALDLIKDITNALAGK